MNIEKDNNLFMFPEDLMRKDFYAAVDDVLEHMAEEQLSTYYKLIDRFQNPQNLDPEVVEILIKEQGYDYLLELFYAIASFQEVEVSLADILSYLGYLSLMKGSIDGLKTIMDLFSLDYDITVWHEYSKGIEQLRVNNNPLSRVLAPGEFKITLENIPPEKMQYFLSKFKAFCYNYVYPTLAIINVNMGASFQANISKFVYARYFFTQAMEHNALYVTTLAAIKGIKLKSECIAQDFNIDNILIDAKNDPIKLQDGTYWEIF